ncbi:hypothetical protein O3P69_016660 [Scylla paramamosain]|uniref:Uncharacterized protein n=1 Tax=Scylla paramamosain TaxID=85552 RepID=A0AAW0SXY3_SCYPA
MSIFACTLIVGWLLLCCIVALLSQAPAPPHPCLTQSLSHPFHASTRPYFTPSVPHPGHASSRPYFTPCCLTPSTPHPISASSDSCLTTSSPHPVLASPHPCLTPFLPHLVRASFDPWVTEFREFKVRLARRRRECVARRGVRVCGMGVACPLIITDTEAQWDEKKVLWCAVVGLLLVTPASSRHRLRQTGHVHVAFTPPAEEKPRRGREFEGERWEGREVRRFQQDGRERRARHFRHGRNELGNHVRLTTNGSTPLCATRPSDACTPSLLQSDVQASPCTPPLLGSRWSGNSVDPRNLYLEGTCHPHLVNTGR